MKLIKIAAAISVLGAISACAPTSTAPQMTPLEIQNMQTRQYEAPQSVVFPSVVSVFQDMGYTITNADIHTGLISAESAADSDEAMKFWLGITSVAQTKATGFVEHYGGKTHVRINFVNNESTSYAYGQTDRNDTPILDTKPYEVAFDKIDNAIFVRTASN